MGEDEIRVLGGWEEEAKESEEGREISWKKRKGDKNERKSRSCKGGKGEEVKKRNWNR